MKGAASRQRRLAAIVLAFAASGCVDQIFLNGYIGNIRRGEAALSTVHDYELGRSMLESNLGQLEVFYKLSPYNEDALYLLTRGWVEVASLFLSDAYEREVAAGRPEWAEYQRTRVQTALTRARFYAAALLTRRDDGFEQASADPGALRAWVSGEFKNEEDSDVLLWAGLAWGPHLTHIVGEPTGAALGAELVRRAVELRESTEHGLGHVALGLYFSRAEGPDLEAARRHFSRAIEVSSGHFLPSRAARALGLYCATGSHADYTQELRRVVAAGDPLPAARLQNIAASRSAARHLAHPRLRSPCRFSRGEALTTAPAKMTTE